MTDRLPLNELTQRDLDELYFDIDNLRNAQDSACRTVALMHEAAVGEVRGPIRGVVEDVADIRERALRAEAAITRVVMLLADDPSGIFSDDEIRTALAAPKEA